jgi:C-terminal processing protease CtpA/Prc
VTFLTEPQRRAVFDKVITLVDTKFSGSDVDVGQLREVHGPRVLGSRTLEDFEQALEGLLRDLKTSHTGFFHEARPRSAGRIAMAATLTKADTAEDGKRWVFQDVHAGGVAAAVGIQSGDVLIAVNDEELIPPAATPFRLGESYTLTVRKRDGSTMRPTLAIPGSREKQPIELRKALLVVAFAGELPSDAVLAGRSVAVFTEALGTQRHHGNVAMLVNEHSASAAEMVAAFASEYQLATLIGTKTAGRLVATSAFKVGFGYRVVMPVATYFTWKGTNLEGRGLAPTIEEPFSFEASIQGRDNQLERAAQIVREAGRTASA